MSTSIRSSTRRVSNRALILAGLVIALLIAGVASYYASSSPDGLEFVAEKTGFLSSAKDSPAADSPFADYQTAGIDNARLSGGVAGVVGVGIVLLVGSGLFWIIRARSRPTAESG